MNDFTCLCNMHSFHCQCHWISIQLLVIKKSAVLFHFPWTILSSCSWSSAYGSHSQDARVLCLWVSVYTRFLEEGSDVHLRAQFLSPFHWFFSCNPRLIELSTSALKRYSVHVHLLNPLPVPFFLSHFCQWWRKAHSPLTNTAFFSNCSGLLSCIKHGSCQLTKIFTTSGNVCARVSFRKHGSASGRVYGSDQIAERNRNKIIIF